MCIQAGIFFNSWRGLCGVSLLQSGVYHVVRENNLCVRGAVPVVVLTIPPTAWPLSISSSTESRLRCLCSSMFFT